MPLHLNLDKSTLFKKVLFYYLTNQLDQTILKQSNYNFKKAVSHETAFLNLKYIQKQERG